MTYLFCISQFINYLYRTDVTGRGNGLSSDPEKPLNMKFLSVQNQCAYFIIRTNIPNLFVL